MKKVDNFNKALQNLKEIYSYEEPYDSVVITGLVGLFEICFEQSWKAMKEILAVNGVSGSQIGSPRQILKSAYQFGLIKDEELWLDALVSRNNVAHAYNQAIAKDIIDKTKSKYYNMFADLKAEIESNWDY